MSSSVLPESTPLYRQLKKVFIDPVTGEIDIPTFIRRIPRPEKGITGDPTGLTVNLLAGKSQDALISEVVSKSNRGFVGIGMLRVQSVHEAGGAGNAELYIEYKPGRTDSANIMGLPYPVDIEEAGAKEVSMAEFLAGELCRRTVFVYRDEKWFAKKFNLSPNSP